LYLDFCSHLHVAFQEMDVILGRTNMWYFRIHGNYSNALRNEVSYIVHSHSTGDMGTETLTGCIAAGLPGGGTGIAPGLNESYHGPGADPILPYGTPGATTEYWGIANHVVFEHVRAGNTNAGSMTLSGYNAAIRDCELYNIRGGITITGYHADVIKGRIYRNKIFDSVGYTLIAAWADKGDDIPGIPNFRRYTNSQLQITDNDIVSTHLSGRCMALELLEGDITAATHLVDRNRSWKNHSSSTVLYVTNPDGGSTGGYSLWNGTYGMDPNGSGTAGLTPPLWYDWVNPAAGEFSP
jgi:hypothetical protein